MSLLKAIKAQLGLSATPANNFQFDASADDGSMKLVRNSGQDVMTVDAAGKVTFPQNAQTWQNMTASRAHSTDYTNSTGQPIKVSVSCNTGAGTGTVSIRVAGLDIMAVGFTISDNFKQLYAEVPTGAVYRLYNYGGANPANIIWMELR
jgi:hypothetical protein